LYKIRVTIVTCLGSFLIEGDHLILIEVITSKELPSRRRPVAVSTTGFVALSERRSSTSAATIRASVDSKRQRIEDM
jgi:hypothetical protein